MAKSGREVVRLLKNHEIFCWVSVDSNSCEYANYFFDTFITYKHTYTHSDACSKKIKGINSNCIWINDEKVGAKDGKWQLIHWISRRFQCENNERMEIIISSGWTHWRQEWVRVLYAKKTKKERHRQNATKNKMKFSIKYVYIDRGTEI